MCPAVRTNVPARPETAAAALCSSSCTGYAVLRKCCQRRAQPLCSLPFRLLPVCSTLHAAVAAARCQVPAALLWRCMSAAVAGCQVLRHHGRYIPARAAGLRLVQAGNAIRQPVISTTPSFLPSLRRKVIHTARILHSMWKMGHSLRMSDLGWQGADAVAELHFNLLGTSTQYPGPAKVHATSPAAAIHT